MQINKLKMQFGERKRKLITSGAICSAKKLFSPVNLLSPDSIQEREEENINVVAQGIPLRIVGYVERIVPGLTNRQCRMHFRVSRSILENVVPIIENMIKKCKKHALEHIFFTQPPLHSRQIFDRRQI
jgi:hypothetical protein